MPRDGIEGYRLTEDRLVRGGLLAVFSSLCLAAHFFLRLFTD
jgi:hypothetical protein